MKTNARQKKKWKFPSIMGPQRHHATGIRCSGIIKHQIPHVCGKKDCVVGETLGDMSGS